jgi:hypothetical protein
MIVSHDVFNKETVKKGEFLALQRELALLRAWIHSNTNLTVLNHDLEKLKNDIELVFLPGAPIATPALPTAAPIPSVSGSQLTLLHPPVGENKTRATIKILTPPKPPGNTRS